MESKKTSNTDSYAVKPTSYAVMPKTPKVLFDEGVTKIRVDDEAAGPFVIISQDYDAKGIQEIRLDFDEIPFVLKAIDELHNDWNGKYTR